MGVFLKGNLKEENMEIEVEQIGEEVHLKYRGFSFVVCRSESNGHVVEVRDVDAHAPVHKNGIQALCWRR